MPWGAGNKSGKCRDITTRCDERGQGELTTSLGLQSILPLVVHGVSLRRIANPLQRGRPFNPRRCRREVRRKHCANQPKRSGPERVHRVPGRTASDVDDVRTSLRQARAASIGSCCVDDVTLMRSTRFGSGVTSWRSKPAHRSRRVRASCVYASTNDDVIEAAGADIPKTMKGKDR